MKSFMRGRWLGNLLRFVLAGQIMLTPLAAAAQSTPPQDPPPGTSDGSPSVPPQWPNLIQHLYGPDSDYPLFTHADFDSLSQGAVTQLFDEIGRVLAWTEEQSSSDSPGLLAADSKPKDNLFIAAPFPPPNDKCTINGKPEGTGWLCATGEVTCCPPNQYPTCDPANGAARCKQNPPVVDTCPKGQNTFVCAKSGARTCCEIGKIPLCPLTPEGTIDPTQMKCKRSEPALSPVATLGIATATITILAMALPAAFKAEQGILASICLMCASSSVGELMCQEWVDTQCKQWIELPNRYKNCIESGYLICRWACKGSRMPADDCRAKALGLTY